MALSTCKCRCETSFPSPHILNVIHGDEGKKESETQEGSGEGEEKKLCVFSNSPAFVSSATEFFHRFLLEYDFAFFIRFFFFFFFSLSEPSYQTILKRLVLPCFFAAHFCKFCRWWWSWCVWTRDKAAHWNKRRRNCDSRQFEVITGGRVSVRRRCAVEWAPREWDRGKINKRTHGSGWVADGWRRSEEKNKWYRDWAPSQCANTHKWEKLTRASPDLTWILIEAVKDTRQSE